MTGAIAICDGAGAGCTVCCDRSCEPSPAFPRILVSELQAPRPAAKTVASAANASRLTRCDAAAAWMVVTLTSPSDVPLFNPAADVPTLRPEVENPVPLESDPVTPDLRGVQIVCPTTGRVVPLLPDFAGDFCG